MKNFHLTGYSVKGIKTLDKLINLSFYKKTITRDMDTDDYNVKGIYGINGSGKSAIIASVDILKNILINPGYLNNPIVQEDLNGIINKKLGELYIEVEYVVLLVEGLIQYRYDVTLSKDVSGKYCISKESLSSKKATSRKHEMNIIYSIENGEIVEICESEDDYCKDFIKKTTNLLSKNSMSSLFVEKVILNNIDLCNDLFFDLTALCFFGKTMHVYMNQSDDHRSFWVNQSLDNTLSATLEEGDNIQAFESLVDNYMDIDKGKLEVLRVSKNAVPKAKYERFEKMIKKLYEFIHIFKNELIDIEIDRKELKNIYVCDLVMVYDSYKIHAEFESTGVKKLINLYAYLREMVNGSVVFIDELDSNLHDVYLCALLEYLMEYGKGQLCFTTHNVGPMDVLKQHSKSIDFLSDDQKIYSWKTCGNYSPSNLYRKGMIQGSPFNVDSIDFIGVFEEEGEDEQ